MRPAHARRAPNYLMNAVASVASAASRSLANRPSTSACFLRQPRNSWHEQTVERLGDDIERTEREAAVAKVRIVPRGHDDDADVPRGLISLELSEHVTGVFIAEQVEQDDLGLSPPSHLEHARPQVADDTQPEHSGFLGQRRHRYGLAVTDENSGMFHRVFGCASNGPAVQIAANVPAHSPEAREAVPPLFSRLDA
jgi:hypothetical protein